MSVYYLEEWVQFLRTHVLEGRSCSCGRNLDNLNPLVNEISFKLLRHHLGKNKKIGMLLVVYLNGGY